MGLKKKLKDMDISLLCHQLALVLKSGIHPMEGIPLISEDMPNPSLKKALAQISDQIVKGTPLHKAFENTECFPDYFISMIHIGEQTGMLESVLENLSHFYENEASIKKKVRSAVSYPVVLAVLMLGVIALIIVKVIPMFMDILTSLGSSIPSQVTFLSSLGNTFENGFAYLFAAILIIIIVVVIISKTSAGRLWLDKLKITNPIWGSTYKKITASRLSGALSLTLKNGMSVTEGFNMVMGVLGNRYVKRKTKDTAEAISQGAALSESLQKTGLFPGLFSRLVKTGEKTGSLDAMMHKISDIYQEEVDASIKRLTGYIEPVFVTVLSVILAGVMLSVILPLINIMTSIG